MDKVKTIKKTVSSELKKAFQQILLHVLLLIIHKRDIAGRVSGNDNPNLEPKIRLTFLTTYYDILEYQVIRDRINVLFPHIVEDKKLSTEFKNHLFGEFIWQELEEIINNESNELLLEVTEFDQGYMNQMIIGEPKSIILLIEMDFKVVDEWFRILDRPNLKTYSEVDEI